MQLHYWAKLTEQERQILLQRPAASQTAYIRKTVTDIIDRVQKKGDEALKQLSAEFDKVALDTLALTPMIIEQALDRIQPAFKEALQLAYNNIYRFHHAQITPTITVETMPGIWCQQIARPIEKVGLYIPGGSAPLFSSVLMLAIPAQIAGCHQIILCSPPPIADEIIYAAYCCNITEIYQVGGAQAIAAMAIGSETIPAVDKIFGPGNAYVTEAKRQVIQKFSPIAIDMAAGPSEVLVIADGEANPIFIAADLLSQAEHGADSQVIFVTPDEALAQAVNKALTQQLALLPRNAIAYASLQKSRLIVAESIAQCVEISNRYAPEHLIIQTDNPEQVASTIYHAGSVFLGAWSPESVGDYASGSNHVLPTYGYAKACSSLGVADFQKRMTLQKITPQALLTIAPYVELLAKTEHLTAHQNAVTLRVRTLKENLS